MKQYNYIYLITNQVNNKIYVGKHPMYGRHLSEEHKAKLKQPRSEESKQKMREAALKREAAKRQKNKENNL